MQATNGLTARVRRSSNALAPAMAVLLSSGALHAQETVDAVAYFQHIQDTRGAGLSRKTKPVDARPATPGEVIVTIIKGEGKETQSPPAKPGDMVVRNRCPETGNEEILVAAETFARRYQGPIEAKAAD